MKQAIMALALLGGCSAAAVPEGQRIDGIDWMLVAMNGMPWPHDASLRIDGGRLSGVGPCNAYSGAQPATPPGFAATGLTWTEMACADPARQRAETEYLAALPRADAMRRDGGALVLTGPGVHLVFERREARGDEIF